MLLFIPSPQTTLSGVETHLGRCSQAGQQKESRRRSHLMQDHVHMMISIPPKTRSRRYRFIKAECDPLALLREKKRIVVAALSGREGKFRLNRRRDEWVYGYIKTEHEDSAWSK